MRDIDNVQQLSTLPVDYLGFIFYAKSPRFTANLPLLPQLPANIQKVGVFVNAEEEYVTKKIKEGLDGVQLHGDERPSFCAAIRQQHVFVIKAFGVDANFDWQHLVDYVDVVDYFLFDTKSSSHGGTGQSFDWSKLSSYPFEKPYFLSGGLSLANIQEAISLADPRMIGLDLNSRFEIAPALKDIHKITNALKIIKDEQISR
ncbi:N-(5'-phosphoribosyl)anthranilate isomerase [Sphingobacterium griseoflavum]|uniref:N-(5'-phosphoribosyl)anthranilate isomerase n=2 Tax=Sphingobacterium griseoflavum TaxID=1474952 RepID=A0ABQ3HWE2_9SPHI|nr:N-(5'-phosphoribosyl)anthranilate isomerase [Sphingobacterium griseoflavum]